MTERSNNLVEYFQQPHSIDVLLALHHLPNPHWSLVEEYILGELGASSISDYCYRCRCQDLVTFGLAKPVKRRGYGPLKKDYHLTPLGHKTVEIIEPALTRAERWRKRALKNIEKSLTHDEPV